MYSNYSILTLIPCCKKSQSTRQSSPKACHLPSAQPETLSPSQPARESFTQSLFAINIRTLHTRTSLLQLLATHPCAPASSVSVMTYWRRWNGSFEGHSAHWIPQLWCLFLFFFFDQSIHFRQAAGALLFAVLHFKSVLIGIIVVACEAVICLYAFL